MFVYAGTFWTVERKFPIALNPLFRVFFGWLLDSRLRRLSFLSDRGNANEIIRESRRVVQDPIVLLKHSIDALNYFNKLFNIEPLWLCPFKVISFPHHECLLNFPKNYNFYLDIGLYNTPKSNDYNPLISHRLMEQWLRYHY